MLLNVFDEAPLWLRSRRFAAFAAWDGGWAGMNGTTCDVLPRFCQQGLETNCGGLRKSATILWRRGTNGEQSLRLLQVRYHGIISSISQSRFRIVIQKTRLKVAIIWLEVLTSDELHIASFCVVSIFQEITSSCNMHLLIWQVFPKISILWLSKTQTTGGWNDHAWVRQVAGRRKCHCDGWTSLDLKHKFRMPFLIDTRL